MFLAICSNFNVKLKREGGASPPPSDRRPVRPGGGAGPPLSLQFYIEILAYSKKHIGI